jgi:Fe(II)/alpha-ketoglutarate-dependent arginine beta-hydroxylase
MIQPTRDPSGLLPAAPEEPASRDVQVLDLAAPELERVEEILERAAGSYAAVDDDAFLHDAGQLARTLPDRLVRFLERWRLSEHVASVVVRGLSVDDAQIGTTPRHWKEQDDPRSTLREELYLALLGSLLGDLFGWSTLQDGHLVHNVVPIAGEEEQQSGHSSTVLVGWHTEDSFHPYRCDYLGLMSLRNLDETATTVASIDAVAPSEQDRRVLGEPRFLIRPDVEHLKSASAPELPSFGRTIRELLEDPQPTPVFFGDPRRPYLRIDPFYMSPMPGDREAEAALERIVEQIESAVVDVVLEPGDVFFVDNFLAVHGRRPFRPRYDGTDRWLKKVSVTRDLRKSRALRDGAASRVVA